jgi:hypothetical protein
LSNRFPGPSSHLKPLSSVISRLVGFRRIEFSSAPTPSLLVLVASARLRRGRVKDERERVGREIEEETECENEETGEREREEESGKEEIEREVNWRCMEADLIEKKVLFCSFFQIIH